MDRRYFIAGLTAGVLGFEAAHAQPLTDLMARLTLFVPTPAGGGWDNIARAMNTALSDERLVSSLNLINQPAGAAHGLMEFIQNYKDRDDALLISGAGMMGAAIMARIPADLTQLTAIARLTTEYMIVVVAPDSSYPDLAALIAALRQDSSTMVCAGGVLGSTDQMLGALLAREAGLRGSQLAYRPYVGGLGALKDVTSGAAAFAVGGLSEMQSSISSGQVRPLAISSTQRLPGVNIPTFVEQGANIVLANWRGVFAPKGISAQQIAVLRQVMEQMTRAISWQATLFQYNWNSYYQTGDAFTAFVQAEASRVRAQLAELGLT